MKNLLFASLFLPGVLLAQGSQLKSFTLKGNIQGLPDGEVALKTTEQGSQVLAKTTTKGGAFELKGAVPETGLYILQFPSAEPQFVFLDQHSGTVKGSYTDLKNLKYDGIPVENDFQEFNRIFNPLIAQLNNDARAAQAGQDPQAMTRYNATADKVRAAVATYVSAHKSSVVSAFLLNVSAGLHDDVSVLESHYAKLTTDVQASSFGKSIKAAIADKKIGAIGSEAIDFTQADMNGNPVSLASFKGKYVLLDFWASWCRPCRMENPNVVKAFNKFKDKNFTILGVSLDQNKDSWAKAVKDDKLAWNHVSDLQQWGNAVAQLYHVQSIPQNFLIDPSGKIIARDLRAEDLERKLCEVLGCN